MQNISYALNCCGPITFRTHEIFVQSLNAADSMTWFEFLVCIIFSYGSRRVRNRRKENPYEIFWIYSTTTEKNISRQCQEAECRVKPWKGRGSKEPHRIAYRSGSIALYRLSTAWVNKVQNLRSDRWFGTLGSSLDFLQVFFHDVWLLGLCLRITNAYFRAYIFSEMKPRLAFSNFRDRFAHSHLHPFTHSPLSCHVDTHRTAC